MSMIPRFENQYDTHHMTFPNQCPCGEIDCEPFVQHSDYNDLSDYDGECTIIHPTKEEELEMEANLMFEQ